MILFMIPIIMNRRQATKKDRHNEIHPDLSGFDKIAEETFKVIEYL